MKSTPALTGVGSLAAIFENEDKRWKHDAKTKEHHPRAWCLLGRGDEVYVDLALTKRNSFS